MHPFQLPAIDEVRAWTCNLDRLPAAVDCGSLSGDERARASRLHIPLDRERWIAGRAWLRHVLAQLLRTDAQRLRFSHGLRGKPTLVDAQMPLQFNLSHSAERALLAVALDRPLGVDIEQVRDLQDAEAIARRHFAPAEIEQWLALAPPMRARGFFAGWTRKEAYVKALGGGLGAIALDSFEVTLAPDQPAQLRSIGGSRDAARAWSLWNLDAAPGFAAAVVAHGAPLRLHMSDET